MIHRIKILVPVSLLALLAAPTIPDAAAQTKMYFTNAQGADLSEYYLYLQGQSYSVNYSTNGWATTNSFNAGANVISTNQVRISDLSGGYVELENMVAGRVNIVRGMLTNFVAPTFDPTGVNSEYSFTYLEGNISGGSGNFDTTYINSFEVPVRGIAYENFGAPSQAATQTNGFDFDHWTTAQAVDRLKEIQPAGVQNIVTNSSGNIIRVLGGNAPFQVGSQEYGRYAPLTDYLNHLKTNNLTVNVSRSNVTSQVQFGATFQTNAITYSNAVYNINLTGEVKSDQALELTGEIGALFFNDLADTNNPTVTYSNVTLTIDPGSAQSLADLIYANPGSGTNLPSGFSGNTNWDNAQAFLQSNTTGAQQIWQIPSGDLFSSIAMGLAGNPGTNTAAGDTLAIKDLSTGDWWAWQSNAVKYYGSATTNTNFYYAFAGVIHEFAPDSYGYVYDDRFKFSPVLLEFGGTTNAIILEVGQATSSIPEARAALLVTLAAIAVAGLKAFSRKRRRLGA